MIHKLKSILSSQPLTISFINMYMNLANQQNGNKKAPSRSGTQQKDKQFRLLLLPTMMVLFSYALPLRLTARSNNFDSCGL